MPNQLQIIQNKSFRYMDETTETIVRNEPFTALTSFAIDDTLAESISDGASSPTMRLWVHPKTVVLGIIDGRLPFLEDGVRYLKQRGYRTIIRNSGGLAVALDDGVLNMSLIIPDVKHISIYEAYEEMVRFIQQMLSDVTQDIKAYEIVGSYCPGDYDLSIDGKKFAGISQRRIKDSAAIQIYLDVEGSSHQRASLVRDFYHHSKKDVAVKFTYPEVDPTTMASLSDLLQTDITVEDMKKRAQSTLETYAADMETYPFTAMESAIFERRLKQMKQRNEDLSSIR